MKTYKKIKIVLSILIISQTIWATPRIWQDLKGKQIEAYFISEYVGTVVLKTLSGKILKIKKDKLSKADNQYLASIIPPKLEIIFSKNQNRKTDGFYYFSTTDVDMKCKIRINKKSKAPFTGELSATLLVIGKYKQGKTLVILDKTHDTFTFKTNKTFQLKGQSFRMSQDNYEQSGIKYAGYLAVVRDQNNKIIAIKSSRKDFLKNHKKLLKVPAGKKLDKNMEIIKTRIIES